MYDDGRVFRLAPDVLSVETDGETVMLSYAGGKYFGLRGAIRQHLDQLRQGATFAELATAMSAAFGVSSDHARDDLNQILSRMQAAGVLEAT